MLCLLDQLPGRVLPPVVFVHKAQLVLWRDRVQAGPGVAIRHLRAEAGSPCVSVGRLNIAQQHTKCVQ